MIKFIEYTTLFIILVLLQVLIFNNLQTGPWINISIYLLFLIVLPNNINTSVSLLVAGALGWAIDSTSGTAGIHTITTLFIAFIRPAMVKIFIGNDENSLHTTPCKDNIGTRKFLSFTVSNVLIFNTILFLLESLSFDHLFFTLLRIVSSTIATSLFIYIFHLLIPFTKKRTL